MRMMNYQNNHLDNPEYYKSGCPG